MTVSLSHEAMTNPDASRRSREGEVTRRSLRWTPAMLGRLRDLVSTDRTAREIGREMGGLSAKQITSKVFHLGLKMGRSPGGGTARFWTTERIARLRELLAQKKLIREAARELGATVSATQGVMARLGLTAARPKVFWTDERVAVMREFAAKGYSGSQIAAQIGDGCSRSGVIIAAKRRGIVLSGRRHVDAPRAPRVGGATTAPRKPSKAKPKAKPAPIDNGEPTPLGGWNDLAARDECKWIEGDPMRTQWRMCAHPVFNDGSWCAHHHLRAYDTKGRA